MHQASVGLPYICVTLVTGLTSGPTECTVKRPNESPPFKNIQLRNPNVYNSNNKVEAQNGPFHSVF